MYNDFLLIRHLSHDWIMFITSDVTVDYNAPLHCVFVPFHRIRTLSPPGAGGDGERLHLQLNKLASQSIHTHPLYIQGTQKAVKVVSTASSYH